MGDILSTLIIVLPLADYLAIPMLSSWSTSLNLLLFSITWTTIAITYAPLQIEFFAPLAARLILYILPSTLFLAFDLLVPSLAVELKTQGKMGLPGQMARGKVARVVWWSCFNVLLGVTLQAGIEWVVTDVLHLRSVLAIKGGRWSLNHLPSPLSMLKNLAAGLVLQNVLQYYIHSTILHSHMNNYLAHWHQTWHHSVRAPYSFAANHDHPICYLIHRFLPLYIPAIIFRFHIMTYLILLSLFSLEEVFTYSGYSVLPSTIMLRGMARRTDVHMMSQGKGNYDPAGVLDWVHGTTLGNDVLDDVRDEMEKHNVQDKAGNALDSVGTKWMCKTGNGKAKR
ncbi:hypothetical protein K432DRAFT_303978 [Lepidopterella palustris CBS 459.81]|uniref:Fatty acid hydroxylase domain-containing protein n=1 Tax=Lepidopterella palustris CBS 459.81 TaxID=1314670 RepID=A0A8E2E537_9PEZI|nr:hypothetical protein K432DRAFT_303978 [Lepidopterella palustris CBS 459.81]